MQPLIPIGNPPIKQDWLGIWYTPLPDEPIPNLGNLKPWKTIQANKTQDPFKLADTYKREVPSGSSVYLLIPGMRFDRFGTRKGRGGGWYDRFLSAVPRTWLRVGVCSPETWSETRLEQNTWDEPMDWLLIEKTPHR
ncbi:MAG: 5-formyltetrahydrofolate cyclo-ligase [Candidatus Uhrbacteria bacterium]